jgi:hypothetical protein
MKTSFKSHPLSFPKYLINGTFVRAHPHGQERGNRDPDAVPNARPNHAQVDGSIAQRGADDGFGLTIADRLLVSSSEPVSTNAAIQVTATSSGPSGP